MPAAAAIVPAAISAGTSIFGALQGRSATNDAVGALLEAFTKAGKTATDTVNTVNPQIAANADKWGTAVINAGDAAAQGATDAAERGATGIKDAVTSGQAQMQPYTAAGTDALKTLSKLLQNPEQFQFQADPGYQFRLQQGQQAIQRSAAARGASGGGGTAKALAQFNSGLAAQDYQDAWSRWNTGKQQRQNGLEILSGMGERAGEYSGTLGLSGANSTASLLENAAQYGGSTKLGSTEWAGNLWSHATDEMSQNSLDLGNFLANLDINQGKTIAAGNIQKGNIWSSLLGGLGTTGGSIFSTLWNGRKKGAGGGGIFDSGGGYLGE